MSRTEPHVEPPAASPSGWLSLGAVRNLWHPFTRDIAAQPPIARSRWISTLVIGFVASAVLVAGMTLWAQSHLPEGTPLAERDALLLRFMADHGPISFSNAIGLESFGSLAYLIPLTLICFTIAAHRRRPLLASAFVVTSVLLWPIVLLGWWIWNRPRPDLIAAGIAAPGMHSFPSGHAALAFSIYGLLTWLWVRSTRSLAERVVTGLLFFLLIVVDGWARLVLGTDWPSDLFAGWAAGLAWVVTAIVAQVRAEQAGGR